MENGRAPVYNPQTLLEASAHAVLDKDRYLSNFAAHNECLPRTLKKLLIGKLMSSTRYDVENRAASVPDWLAITERQFCELLRCDKTVALHDPAERHRVAWYDADGLCWRCAAKENRPALGVEKVFVECAECGFETLFSYDADELNMIAFDGRNWCRRCCVVPLFAVKRSSCRFCALFDQYGDAAATLMVVKFGYECVKKLIY